MAFTQETKPKIKNMNPIIRMEIWVSLLLKAETETALFIILKDVDG